MDVVSKLKGSKRFWTLVGSALVVALHELLGIPEDAIWPFVTAVSAMILGYSVRDPE